MDAQTETTCLLRTLDSIALPGDEDGIPPPAATETGNLRAGPVHLLWGAHVRPRILGVEKVAAKAAVLA